MIQIKLNFATIYKHYNIILVYSNKILMEYKKRKSSSSGSIDAPPAKKSKNIESLPVIKDLPSVYKKVVIRNDHDLTVKINIDIPFVKIGYAVYKTAPLDFSWPKDDSNELIELTISQINDLDQFMCDGHIMVKPYFDVIHDISSINLSILYWGSRQKTATNLLDATSRIKKHILNFPLTTYQTFEFSIENNFCCVRIDSSQINVTKKSKMDTVTYGKVGHNTKIELRSDCSDLVLQSDPLPIDTSCLKATITAYFNKASISTGIVQIIHENELQKIIKKLFKESFSDGETRYHKCAKHNINIKMQLKLPHENPARNNIYKILGNHKIEIEILPLKLISYNKIVNIIEADFVFDAENDFKYSSQDCFIYVPDLIAFLQEKVKYITFNSDISYPYKGNTYTIKNKIITPNSFDEKVVYRLNDYSKIRFDSKKFMLIKNKNPVLLKTIELEISVPKNDIKAKAEGIFKISDMETKIENYCINTEDLITKIKKFEHVKFCLDLPLTIVAFGKQIKAVVKKISYDENLSTDDYKVVGYVNENTEISLVKKDNPWGTISFDTERIIRGNLEPVAAVNPLNIIEEYVGGVSGELKNIIKTICLSRGKLKDEYLARGLKPVKGLILHGPPGTGKTTIARHLGKLLDCKGEQFKLMSGSEIFKKHIGESEKNIRNIFKEAKEAWIKFGSESPTYMVIIDEIDAMLPKRTDTINISMISIVDQFLSEIDGLVEFHNLICIGITNRLELIDPAVTRPGRMGTHIKIDIPDEKGRLDIFKIHTRELRKLNRMKNVKLEKLVSLTDNFSGAEIESVVEKASSLSLDRLSEIDEITEELIIEKGSVTLNDFIKSISEIKSGKKYEIDHRMELYN